MKIINPIEIVQMIDLEKDYSMDYTDINDKELKKYLCFYDFLRNNFENLSYKENKKIILYSEYYWYMKYKQRYFEIIGYDAGIEQEGFKLLQEIENELECGVDWGIIQEIEERLKR